MKKNLVNKVLKINAVIFPHLIGFSFLLLAIESYTYTGFLKKYTFVDSQFFFVLSIVSVCLVILLQITNKSYKASLLENLVVNLNSFLLPFTTIAYFTMITLNSVKYSNYIFSVLHIQPQNFLNILLLSIFVFTLKIISYNNSKKWLGNIFAGINIKLIFLLILTSMLLLEFVASSFIETIENVAVDLSFISTHLNDSYDQKMQDKWGILYKYISLIKASVPVGSSILLPESKPPHSVDGRIEYYRYFLVDRKITNYDSSTKVEDYDYVLLTKGYLHPTYDGSIQKNYIWPNFPVDSEKITYLDGVGDGSYFEETIYSDYNPDDYRDKYVWGIIKVNK